MVVFFKRSAIAAFGHDETEDVGETGIAGPEGGRNVGYELPGAEGWSQQFAQSLQLTRPADRDDRHRLDDLARGLAGDQFGDGVREMGVEILKVVLNDGVKALLVILR